MRFIVKSCIALGLLGLALLAFVAMTGTAKADIIVTYDFTAVEEGTGDSGHGYVSYDLSMPADGGSTAALATYHQSGSEANVSISFTPTSGALDGLSFTDSDIENYAQVTNPGLGKGLECWSLRWRCSVQRL